MMAWHFVGETLRDGSPVPRDGKWLEYKGWLKMCESGLHASIDPFDALQFAPGPILCRVECGGEIIQQDDKLVCSRRKIIVRMDATEMLRYFARMQALSVIHLYPNGSDDVVFDYLMTGEEKIRPAAWRRRGGGVVGGSKRIYPTRPRVLRGFPMTLSDVILIALALAGIILSLIERVEQYLDAAAERGRRDMGRKV